MTAKILLDTGPSRRGWHRLEAALRCMQLYAFQYLVERQPEEESDSQDALVRGTIGHVGLAHYYARKRAGAEKSDPNVYYSTSEAMQMVAERHGPLGLEMLKIAAPTVEAYLGHYATDTIRVVEIERLYESTIRDSRGRGPHDLTARIDLQYEDSGGRVVLADHKFVSRIESGTVTRYTLSGQFLVHRWLGQAMWGPRFGGVVLNLLQVHPRPRFERIPLPPAPGLGARLPQIICDIEERIAALEVEGRDPWEYPASPTEMTCKTPYGPCRFFDRCRWGK